MTDIETARFVRELRQRAYLTQKDLAGRSGTSQPALARLEAGIGNPTLATLTRLAEAAGYGLELKLVERQRSDPMIEQYREGIDRTLLRRNLELTVDQRIRELEKLQRFDEEVQRAGRGLRRGGQGGRGGRGGRVKGRGR